MSRLFESNLAILETYDPPLAARLRSHVPTGRAEVFATPNAQPSLRLRIEGRTILLHSGREPMREAERWVEGLNQPPMYNLMVFGCGMMYHTYQLVVKYQASLRHLVLVEKEMDVVHAAFSTIDLSPFLNTKTTFFLVDPDPVRMRDFLNRYLTPFVLNGLAIVQHPASCEVHREYYDGLKQVVDESLQSGEILLRTKVQLGGMIQENIIRNLPAILANPTAIGLVNVLPNVPGFVVGAGPSLDKNVDQLRRVGDSGVIIASDTVLRKLRGLGVEPHIVVTTDPTYLNARHFEGVTDLGRTILVFSPSVYHEIPKQLVGTKVSVPLPGSRFLRTLKDVLGDPSYMKTGTNVGQTCYNLARLLGCNPIALVGMDLSFSASGGTTHAAGTALRRNIYLSETPGKMKVELIAEKPELEEFDPIRLPGNLGGQVATSKFWLAYLRSLEEEIRVTPARVINATEGGARIEGTEFRPLAEVIDAHCTRDALVGSSLQVAIGFFFGLYGNEGKAVLREGSEILKTAIEKAEKGQRKIEALNTIAQSVSPRTELLKETLDVVVQIHKDLIQDQKVYVILDEAADQVLTPFLRLENRPVGEETAPDNVRKTIERYENYFADMKTLCETFLRITEETLQTLDESPSTFSF